MYERSAIGFRGGGVVKILLALFALASAGCASLRPSEHASVTLPGEGLATNGSDLVQPLGTQGLHGQINLRPAAKVGVVAGVVIIAAIIIAEQYD